MMLAITKPQVMKLTKITTNLTLNDNKANSTVKIGRSGRSFSPIAIR